jgi:hypothetical protein
MQLTDDRLFLFVEHSIVQNFLEDVPSCQKDLKPYLSKVKATSRSVQAFKDYLRVDDFEEIR